MTTSTVELIPSKQIETDATSQYTAENVTARIGAFTATNTGASAASLSVYLVQSGQSVAAGTTIIQNRLISPGETYRCPELIGHVIESGGQVYTSASLGATITVRASGVEISL